VNLTTVDRNRLTVVVLFTVIVSVLYFVSSGRSEGDTSGDPASATTTLPGNGTGLYTDPNSVVDAPASLQGPGAAEAGGGGPIAYPADEDLNTARGRASFKRYPQGGERGCSTGLAPLATRIRVRNLDNGRTTTCTNVYIGPQPGGFEIVLDITVFESIAEIVQAPLPVEISW
jgi:hypothetical protein